ncbi:MAG: hypothetical protein IPP88_02345 [Betaproteobacteria bacterium]|nr:hypothetical protein [Betaproteobacteria bacterium]
MARLKIKMLPDDIRGIYVRDPLTDEYLWVPNTEPEYAEGKGWHQHKIIQAYAKTLGTGKVDQEGLRIAEAKIARQIKKVVKRGGGKRGNKHVARYENVAQSDYQQAEAAQAERNPSSELAEFSDEPGNTNFGERPLFVPTELPPAQDGWEVNSD